MPNPAHPPVIAPRLRRGAALPMRVEGGSFRGYHETIHLRPAPMDPDNALLLIVDHLEGHAAIRLIEPNVRELRDMLDKWLGEN